MYIACARGLTAALDCFRENTILEVQVSRVVLIHHPTRDPRDEKPAPAELDSVVAALTLTYELSSARDFQVGTEISKDGQVIYDESTLSSAIGRIRTLVKIDGMPLEQAAKQVAEEDGHAD
jgi:hypothetical protein